MGGTGDSLECADMRMFDGSNPQFLEASTGPAPAPEELAAETISMFDERTRERTSTQLLDRAEFRVAATTGGDRRVVTVVERMPGICRMSVGRFPLTASGQPFGRPCRPPHDHRNGVQSVPLRAPAPKIKRGDMTACASRTIKAAPAGHEPIRANQTREKILAKS